MGLFVTQYLHYADRQNHALLFILVTKEQKMAIHTGGCSCGQVRFQLRSKPMFTHACHCHLCQQSTGSAFILHSLIEGDLFELISGKLADFEGPSGSGRRHIVKRCSRCGDPIVSYFGETEHVAIVKTGALDDPSTFPPEAHIFVDTKLSWIKLTDKMPQFEGFYDFEATWSPDSYSRLVAARSKS